jgi:3-hydroxyacyl-[acyl-carrier-protein] dehydratase
MKLNSKELSQILGIEPPFLMIDELIDFVPMMSAHTVKYFNSDEWFMKCHLVSAPVMPGTLQTELMLQTFAILVYLSSGQPTRRGLLRGFDTTCFHKLEPKDSGRVLHAVATIVDNKRGIVKGNAVIKLGDVLVSSCRMTMVMPDTMPVPRPAANGTS